MQQEAAGQFGFGRDIQFRAAGMDVADDAGNADIVADQDDRVLLDGRPRLAAAFRVARWWSCLLREGRRSRRSLSSNLLINQRQSAKRVKGLSPNAAGKLRAPKRAAFDKCASAEGMAIDRDRRCGQETAMYQSGPRRASAAHRCVAPPSANFVALRLLGPGFPWGTMAINIAGSLAMGVFIETAGAALRRVERTAPVRRHRHPRRLHHLLRLLAGFRRAVGAGRGRCRRWPTLLASVVGAILALFLGLWLARSLG